MILIYIYRNDKKSILKEYLSKVTIKFKNDYLNYQLYQKQTIQRKNTISPKQEKVSDEQNHFNNKIAKSKLEQINKYKSNSKNAKSKEIKSVAKKTIKKNKIKLKSTQKMMF